MSHDSSAGFEDLPLRDPISQTFTKTRYRRPIKVSQFHSPPTPKLPLFNGHIQTDRRLRRIEIDGVLSDKPLLLGIHVTDAFPLRAACLGFIIERLEERSEAGRLTGLAERDADRADLTFRPEFPPIDGILTRGGGRFNGDGG